MEIYCFNGSTSTFSLEYIPSMHTENMINE